MTYVDIHAHLDIASYQEYQGIDALLKECAAHKVIVVANGVDINSNREVLEFQSKYPNVKAALGIYPWHCTRHDDNIILKEINFIEQNILSGNCIAIGEVGLDFKEQENNIIDFTAAKSIQIKCLDRFLQLSKKHNIPIILHSRNAESELVELLERKELQNHKIIMHCFSGKKNLIRKIRNNGWFFSIPCTIVRSQHFQMIVKEVPLTQLFTETDSPYLSPVPEKTNRPDNVMITINKIAEIKQMTPEEVKNIIYNNYQRLFM